MASTIITASCREISGWEASPQSRVPDYDTQSTLSRRKSAAPARRSPSDEELVRLVRRGQQSAFDTLAARYQTRLLWFCRQILRSKEDAEDALQDVFTSAFSAILADDREIQVRAWLYRIARNRCINHLRRAKPVAAGSMDDHLAEHGRTLVEKVGSRQRLRELVSDVQALPDTQRTALLLCEIDGFSYQQIALATSTTVPAVKSLLVRARTHLHNSAAARDATRASVGRKTTYARKRAPGRRSSHPVSYQSARAAAINIT